MTEHSSRWTRSTSFALIVAIYVVAIGAALAAASAVGIDRPFVALIAAYAASVAVLYVPSQLVGNGSTFDAWWSVVPPAVAIWFAFAAPNGNATRAVLLVTCAVLWGLRLTSNWAIGWTGLAHEDWRYRKLYADTPLPRWATSLLAVHVAPMVFVTLGSLPMIPALVTGTHAFGVLDVVATVVALLGVSLEQFADLDLRRFNRSKKPGDVLDQGLWSRSRHPNYLGEMMWWIGLWLFALAADLGAWWTIVGPLTMIVMFLTASIPLAEARSAERRPGWAEYAARTPRLLPRLSRSTRPTIR